ncbi:MAG TPA: 2-amino-4-hydroxy-6-hydroxymethyldihydropteridine diphosphokinase [Flavobacteriales bacterium]|nr:2-amino-4-hydroxy-6-hydroxymethyldihydropteridine diphosphokinase [Flavobacteriales bacterium]
MLRTYYIGAGTNLGDKVLNMENAMNYLNTPPLGIKALSTLHNFKAWGYTSDNEFLNACFVIETELGPQELLEHLKQYEKEQGRERSTEYADRIIDMDILLCEGLVWWSEALIIPHPLLQKREFVLVPLCEINEELVHPLLHKSMKQLLDELMC